MNPLMNQTFKTKITLSRPRFVSSAVISQNPSSLSRENEKNLSAFAFRFIAERTKSRNFTPETTKVLHAFLLKLQPNVFLLNSLLDWYMKDSVIEARKLFDTIPQPNVISWNTMISGYNHKSWFEDAWRVFCKMHFLGFEPNEITYGSVLSACSALQAPVLAKVIYSLTVKNGLFSNGYVRTGLIHLFSENRSFGEASRVFRDVIDENNVVCWNAIVSGAVRNGEHFLALKIFQEMLCGGFSMMPDSYTFSSVLSACATLEELKIGKTVQGWVIKCAAEDVFVGTALVDLYAKCGNMDEAAKVFSRIPNSNVVSWTAMISGYVKKDDYISALKIFKEMRNIGVEINNYTVTSIITACANPCMIIEAIQVHAWVVKSGFYSDSVVIAALINMYSKTGAIDLSRRVFEDAELIQSPHTWNVMISSLAQNQMSRRAIELFRRMLKEDLRPDTFCISSLLSVIDCSSLGRQIHGHTLKTGLLTDLSVSSSLFTMYSKCGSLEDSFKVFEQIPVKDNVSWASMIAGFSEHCHPDEAVRLFRKMLSEGTRPDETTLSAILTVCASLPSFQKGKEIHGYAFRSGIDKEPLIGSALVNMYTKCGLLGLARRVFDMLPEQDQFSCSSLVSGYSRNGLIDEASLLFREMAISDLAIDSFTASSILWAIALSDRFLIGAQLHAHITKIGLDREPSVGSSLVMMYSKFGSIEDCCKAFSQIDGPDLIAWTAMIASYAQHGKGMEALRAYHHMREKGVQPDKVTFVGVLSACSHSGLVEEAYFHLKSMEKDYGIQPDYRHYACMVDVLGRAGRLKEAEELINSMPIEPDALVWGTLLAACKVQGDIDLGKLAAKKVIELEPSDAGAYVSLSNILAELGEWEEVEETRNLMKGTGVRKEPGRSFL